MESKYLGKVYEDYEVVNCYVRNNYYKSYNNNKKTVHTAYSFTLVNYNNHISLTISGNQLRLIDKGIRSISDMLSSTARASKNTQLNKLKKVVR